MKCIEYSELISAYVDEMLSPQEEEKLMMHLKTCQACQKELEVLKQMQMMCQHLEEVPLPDKFHEELMRRLKVENKVKSPIKFKWQYGGALVATMLVGILFFNQLGLSSSKNETATGYATKNQVAEDNTTTEVAPYASQSQVAEARMQDEAGLIAHEKQLESSTFMAEETEAQNAWKVEVEDSKAFIEALKAYLDKEQIVYEQIEEGMSIYHIQDSKSLMDWLKEHSFSFEGSEVTPESNIQLEIK